MTKKCCIPGCRSNYAPSKKQKQDKGHTKVFRLPRKSDELELWKRSLPYNCKKLTITKDSLICVKHWPSSYATVSGKGNKERPVEPPSVWPGVPASCVPAPPNPPRPTSRTSLSVRDIQPDQMDEFLRKDRVSFSEIVERVVNENYKFCDHTVSYLSDSTLYIQAAKFSEGIPRFIIKIEENMKFCAFHMGVKVTIP